MIVFDNVSVDARGSHSDQGAPVRVLSSVSASLPTDRRIAVLGHDDAVKTTFVNLLAGLTLPGEGRIRRHARLSFPVGYDGGLRRDLSVRQNVAHVARIYNANIQEVVRFVTAVAEVGEHLEKPYGRMPRPMRAFFTTILAYAIPFDVYLVGKAIARGDRTHRDRLYALFEARAKESGIILTPNSMKLAKQYCDMGIILHEGAMHMFDSVDDAIAAFATLAPPKKVAAPIAEEDTDTAEEPEDF